MDGTGTKPGNSIPKMIRIDNNELTDFEKCISIFRSILTQLICQTSVVSLLAEGTKNDEHYKIIWSFIHPNKEEDKKKDTDRLPRVINDYQSLIQFIQVMRLVLCKPSDIVKDKLLGTAKLSQEAQSYITDTLAPAVFSICGKTAGPSTASANKSVPKTSISGKSPSSTNMTSMMNVVSRTMPSSMPAMNVNNMGSVQHTLDQLKEIGITKVNPKMIKLAKRMFWLGKRFLPKENAEQLKTLIEHFSEKGDLTTTNIREALTNAGFAEAEMIPETEINEIKHIHDMPESKINAEIGTAELPEEEQTEAQPEPEAQAQPEEAQAQPEEAQAQPEEAQAQPEPEAQAQPEPEAQAQPEEAQAQPEEAQAQPEQEAHAELEAQPEEAHAELEAQPEPEAQAQPEQQPELEAQPEPAQPEPEAQPVQGGGARLKNKTHRKKHNKYNKYPSTATTLRTQKKNKPSHKMTMKRKVRR